MNYFWYSCGMGPACDLDIEALGTTPSFSDLQVDLRHCKLGFVPRYSNRDALIRNYDCTWPTATSTGEKPVSRTACLGKRERFNSPNTSSRFRPLEEMRDSSILDLAVIPFLSTLRIRNWSSKSFNSFVPRACFALCRRPVPFEIGQDADSGYHG